MNKPALSPITIEVSPLPCKVGDVVTIRVTGLGTDAYLNLDVLDDGGTSVVPVGTAVNGMISAEHRLYWAGLSRVEVRARQHARWVVLATDTFQVTEP